MDNFNGLNPMRDKELKNSSLSHVKLKGTALKTSEHQNLINDIIYILKTQIPNLNSLKYDISLIDNICNLIENNDCKTTVDKKEVAKEIIVALFNELNNEKDLELISRNIDSVVDLSKNVKKLAKSTKFFKNAQKWVLKKLA